MWVYNSPIGLMRISQNKTGRCDLRIEDTVYGSYLSAVAAADDVQSFVTGCYEWDMLDGTLYPPSDLSEWEQILE